MTEPLFVTISLPITTVNDLLDAEDHLDGHLIGPIPACYRELGALLMDNHPGPFELVGGEIHKRADDGREELTPAEEAELDAVLEHWASAEGRAEEARAERYAAFRADAQAETSAQLQEWFNDYTEKYQRDLATYQRMRGNCLKAAFAEQEARVVSASVVGEVDA